MTNVLFVCLGNICRSPMAEVMFRQMVKDAHLENQITVASAAISTEEHGNPPHPGAIAELAKHGLSVGNKTSTPITKEDFDQADYIIAMDNQNIFYLNQMAPIADRKKIFLCYNIIPDKQGKDIPDPWFDHKFGRTYRQLSETLHEWLDKMKSQLA
ncbi:low molecular weight protein-tyrosine-phosphatase [Lentilactobacillus buchneri]|uniref:protein-tyrosine-phosphatase n=1 Tax=Lentilactobacillus buchneri DSM 20057 TaxID=1423728 RepID=A0A4R5NLH3_LENBU|nr:low molecular weight protein-tyrosine-phosphatase [Lentilactobacillus buchneri]MCT3252870.1 low molecular weight phosphotyrosine protein phosphatase [Lentilactobacillus buchneri]MCT3547464.1 low molecular weight phosphotyrosine protein phosphatase [Lentilactobacillus buchneri]MCT4437866.1 low molecular weight phosphotyrosine protein phosphatase [Lentilactobacillus buchneri]MQM70938.1 low molecular weight phosphotyrosine protein phosphatase [Lentilactobacillus buchneri]QUX05941.1 low molecul